MGECSPQGARGVVVGSDGSQDESGSDDETRAAAPGNGDGSDPRAVSAHALPARRFSPPMG